MFVDNIYFVLGANEPGSSRAEMFATSWDPTLISSHLSLGVGRQREDGQREDGQQVFSAGLD